MFAKIWRRFGYLMSAEGREFLRLYSACARRERHRPLSNVRFKGLVFDVPDAPSFFWQYVDIFRNSSYFFRGGHSCPVVYDCGANVGVSVAYFKMLYPDARVTAFEPDENVFGYLHRNLSRNELMEDVVLYNAAVWVHSDGVAFDSDGADGGRVAAGETMRRVSSVDLAELLANEKCVDLLKMDIEGAESVVLPSLKRVIRRVRRLFCEYHSWGTERNGTERGRWDIFWRPWMRLVFVIGSFRWGIPSHPPSSAETFPGRSIFLRLTRRYRCLFPQWC